MTVVSTSLGAVRGVAADGVVAFKGIPYAAPPFGPRRFAAPQPVMPWDGVRDATAFGPTAPHPGYAAPFDALLPEVQIPGEDCLSVNVWAPVDAADLSVMVWIHGGAFVNGSGAIPTYDGSGFARDGVVCVTLNYRLGVEGWLFFGDGGAENRGLLDQLAALRWVQEEIAAFGGDPARVTVFGESAGAMSIGTLLATPAAVGLFAQAILQSGAAHHAITPVTAALVRGELARELGLDAGADGVTRDALAAVDPARLLTAQVAVGQAAQTAPDPDRWGEVALNVMPWEPVVDGEVLPRAPRDATPPDVRLLVGTNAEEHRLWLVPSGIVDVADEAALAFVAGRYGVDPAPYADGRTPGERLSAVMGDWFFRAPAIALAEAAAGPVFLYEFAWGGPLGACHAVELGFVFDTLGARGSGGLTGEHPPRALADTVHAAWVAFARDGDPGWPAYDLDRRTTMVFDDPVSRPVDDPRPGEREAWRGVR